MSQLLHQFIENAVHFCPEAEALSHKQARLSYAELHHHIQRISTGLLELGLQHGERVAVYLPKQEETVVSFFATVACGGIFVPINPLIKSQQVEHILQDSGASVLITSKDRAKLLASVLPECKALKHVVLVDGDTDIDTAPAAFTTHLWHELLAAQARPAPRITDDTTAAILYTSGSTGKPKGVVLSHRNMVTGAKSVSQYLQITPEDRLLAVLPFSFDYGLSQLTIAFHSHASVTLMNYLLPREVINIIHQEQITGLAAVPPLWSQLAALEWPVTEKNPLRFITNSGGAMPKPILAALQEKLAGTDIFLMYGLTEAFRSTYLPPSEIHQRPGSMGKAIPNAEILVVNKHGEPCASGEPGELVHGGPLVAKGYWNDPHKTAIRFKPAPAAMKNVAPDDLVVWSGDTVSMDDDGFLYFVGREDEMIKTSGYRVSPTEIEEVILASGLAGEAAVFGVPHPTLGQAIVAIVTPATQTDDGETTLVQQILTHCKKTLPTFMVPLHIEIKKKLPKTPNGKIDRNSLKQAFQQHFADTP